MVAQKDPCRGVPRSYDAGGALKVCMNPASQPNVKKEFKLRVSSVAAETDDIKRYELVSSTGEDLPSFTAGAHIDIIMGNQMRRSYSLANAPSERHRYVIAVLRESAGRGGSAWMHD